MTFHRRLLERTRNIGNSLCVGLDPVMRKLPRSEGAAADRVHEGSDTRSGDGEGTAEGSRLAG